MNPPAFTLTHESVTVIHEGRPFTIQKGTPQFFGLRDAIFREDWAGVIDCLSTTGALQQYLGMNFQIRGSDIYMNNQPLPRSIQDRIHRMAATGESPAPLFRFYERLAKNPSMRSVQQLFDFLKHANIPLEEDGRFLAYKAVTEDFKDVHTKTLDYTPGTVHKMERNLVSDDPNTACHYGFHVGALGYASTFHPSGQMVICRVDPENVVCVPYDYSHQKMRVCEFEVVGLYSGTPLANDVHREEVVPDEEGEWNDRDDDEDEDSEDEEDKSIFEEDRDENDEPVFAGAVKYDDAPGPDLRNNQAQNEDVIVKQLRVLEDENKKVVAKQRSSKASQFARMNAEKLMDQSIGDLRAYATHRLKLVGASKIPGGKSALVSKILKIRRKK